MIGRVKVDSLRCLSWTFWQMRMLLFCGFITKYFQFKREKGGEIQFCKNFLKETNFTSNKNDLSEEVKVESFRCLSWTFWQMRIFLFGNFVTKYLQFKREKAQERYFCKNFEKETNYSSSKNNVRRRVKVESLRY